MVGKRERKSKLVWTKILLMLIPRNICIKLVLYRGLYLSHFDPHKGFVR